MVDKLHHFKFFLFKLLIALLAGHFIVVHGAQETWFELFTYSYYYTSVCYSSIIAFVLIEGAHLITIKLNNLNDGAAINAKRIKEQVVFGIIVLMICAFLMAMVLFWLNGQNIFHTGYFNKLFVQISLFIVVLNTVYLLYYNQNVSSKTKYQLIVQKRLEMQELIAKAISTNSPAIIYHDDKAYFAIDFKGNKTGWNFTIEESIQNIDRRLYFQINRYAIIHRAAIVSFEAHTARTVKLILNVPCSLPMLTSKRKNTKFKNWLVEFDKDREV